MQQLDDQNCFKDISNISPSNVTSHIKVVDSILRGADNNLHENKRQVKVLREEIPVLQSRIQANIDSINSIIGSMISKFAQNIKNLANEQKEENRNFTDQITELKKQKQILKKNVDTSLKISNFLLEEVGQY